MNQSDYGVDVSKCAKIEFGEEDITLIWEEIKDIYRVVIVTSEPCALSGVRIQYWQHGWPHQTIQDGKKGQWKDADIRVILEGNDAARTIFPIVFKPINFREFPDIGDFDAEYRRTTKLRVRFRRGMPGIERIEAYTR
jgi:hypothetical protein